jgi:hypothetical protein
MTWDEQPRPRYNHWLVRETRYGVAARLAALKALQAKMKAKASRDKGN